MNPALRGAPADDRRPRVDVPTGRLTVVDLDEQLPHLLAQLLTRTYVSTWAGGLSLDPRWAWGLDERVEVDQLGLRLLRGDGAVVRLADLSDDADAPVRRAPGGGYVVTDPDSGLQRHYLGAVPGGVPLAALRDHDGRRVSVVRSDGGRPLQVRDTAGHRVLIEAESGRVRRVHHLAPGAAPRETELAHDDRGRLVEVRAPGRRTRFGADDEGRLTAWSVDDGTELHFGLDDDGAVVVASDGRSEVRIERRDGTVAESVDGRAVVSEHDNAGRRTSRTTPSGSVARWTHDQDGRPVSVSAGGLEVVVARDADGQVVRRHLGDGALLDLEWASGADGDPGGPRLVGQRLRRVPRTRSGTGTGTGTGSSLADRLGGRAPAQAVAPVDETPQELLSESYPVDAAPPDPPADPAAPTDPLGRPLLPGVVWDGDLVAETTSGGVTSTWTFLDDVPVLRETRDAPAGRAHTAYVLTGPGGEVVAVVTPDGEVAPGEPDRQDRP